MYGLRDFSTKKRFLRRHIFSHFSRSEKLSLVARHKRTKFGLDPKRGSVFPKENSLDFKKCPFSSYFLGLSSPNAQDYQHGNIA